MVRRTAPSSLPCFLVFYGLRIIVLAAAASVLVYLFKANLTHLIQLYLIGVFISFTLAQAGTVKRWMSAKGKGWQRRAAINAFGAVLTGVVLVVTIWTKFLTGAWIVIVIVPVLIALMTAIGNHLVALQAEVMDPKRRPKRKRPGNQHLVIYVGRMDVATARAVAYAKLTGLERVPAITTDRTHLRPWRRLAPDIPLELVEGRGSLIKVVRGKLRRLRAELPADDFRPCSSLRHSGRAASWRSCAGDPPPAEGRAGCRAGNTGSRHPRGRAGHRSLGRREPAAHPP